MPKYFVRVEPCGFEEEDGNEFAGPDEAIKLAIAVAGDLLKSKYRIRSEELVVVRDEAGTVIHEQPVVLH